MHTFVCQYKVTLYFSVDDFGYTYHLMVGVRQYCTKLPLQLSHTFVKSTKGHWNPSSLFRTEPLTHWWLI